MLFERDVASQTNALLVPVRTVPFDSRPFKGLKEVSAVLRRVFLDGASGVPFVYAGLFYHRSLFKAQI